MNLKLISTGILASMIFISCSNEAPESTESTENTESNNAPVQVQESTPAQGTEVSVTTGSDAPQGHAPGQIVAPQQTNAPAPTAAGMNPPHGQPGHRCDVPDGAPLNSAPSKPAAPTLNATPSSAPTPISVTPSAAPTNNTPTPAGMNPPHGQPGHDCAIAVGAPLKK